MGKNRDRLSLLAAILEAAGSGSKKTRIMYRANMSFRLLEKYLDVAIEVGFVKVDGSSYVLTDYGREFLKEHRNFKAKRAKVQDALELLAHERNRLSQLCGKPSAPNGVNSRRISQLGYGLFEDLDRRNRNPNSFQDELNRKTS